ncbi:MAG: DUF192 domain-containing protein [Candidatus Aenigmarchaeota archaeon]|nr:DUF192 domain-containing protein [Candidatus Aenigmarchaeota archaeon]
MRLIKITPGNSEFEVLHLKNFFELMLGLMFRKEGNAIMEFGREGKCGIWMLFMRYSLNLIFLDKNKKVVDLIEKVPPLGFNPKTWKIYYPKKKCKYVLELDARKRIQIKKNSKLSIQS